MYENTTVDMKHLFHLLSHFFGKCTIIHTIIYLPGNTHYYLSISHTKYSCSLYIASSNMAAVLGFICSFVSVSNFTISSMFR